MAQIKYTVTGTYGPFMVLLKQNYIDGMTAGRALVQQENSGIEQTFNNVPVGNYVVAVYDTSSGFDISSPVSITTTTTTTTTTTLAPTTTTTTLAPCSLDSVSISFNIQSTGATGSNSDGIARIRFQVTPANSAIIRPLEYSINNVNWFTESPVGDWVTFTGFASGNYIFYVREKTNPTCTKQIPFVISSIGTTTTAAPTTTTIAPSPTYLVVGELQAFNAGISWNAKFTDIGTKNIFLNGPVSFGNGTIPNSGNGTVNATAQKTTNGGIAQDAGTVQFLLNGFPQYSQNFIIGDNVSNIFYLFTGLSGGEQLTISITEG